jgi:hypothetical protein
METCFARRPRKREHCAHTGFITAFCIRDGQETSGDGENMSEVTRTVQFELPSRQEMIGLFEDVSTRDSALWRIKETVEPGRYVDPFGRREFVQHVILTNAPLGAFNWLGG